MYTHNRCYRSLPGLSTTQFSGGSSSAKPQAGLCPGGKTSPARLLQQIAKLPNVRRVHVADREVADPVFDPSLRSKSIPADRRRVAGQGRGLSAIAEHEDRDAML